ncbi:MAG: thiamine phosphate synthase [Hyphomicrobium sp.]|nr:thiamine phosphate synthase [Hyphomicrobium sp.]
MRTDAPNWLSRFYPIVPDSAWLARVLPLGVETVQLRIKDMPADLRRRDIVTGVEIARRHRAQLIVNDYWQDAMDAGADFVHLGQEDLAGADVKSLKRRAIRLGISTHSPEELEIALREEPDYVALGPIYETRLKAMPWTPQGLSRIADWKRRIGGLPLVAIGGITPDRAPEVLAAGAQSVAVITDFMSAASPEDRIATWVQWANISEDVASKPGLG